MNEMKLLTAGLLTSVFFVVMTPNANAVPITYDFAGTFQNGSAYSGFFQYDTSGNQYTQTVLFGMTTADEAFGTPGGLDLYTDSAIFTNDSANDWSIRGAVDASFRGYQ